MVSLGVIEHGGGIGVLDVEADTGTGQHVERTLFHHTRACVECLLVGVPPTVTPTPSIQLSERDNNPLA
jgi:hypothetical protein